MTAILNFLKQIAEDIFERHMLRAAVRINARQQRSVLRG